MTCVCIIPARGQSKRLPRKNILPLAGRPMLAWPVAAARQSGIFNQILVSTEDNAIAAAARAAGADVSRRPPELARDHSTVVDVCLQVLGELAAAGVAPDIFCCLYATAAFVSVDDLVASHSTMKESPKADFVMGVCEYDLSPLLALKETADGTLVPMWPAYQNLQSQDFPRLLCSSGTFYWARTEAFYITKSFYGPPLKGYVLPRSRALDIDTPEDYEDALRRAAALLETAR